MLIKLKPNFVLLKPDNTLGNSFASETRKYERRSLAEVVEVSSYVLNVKPHQNVVYDDSNSIDFTWEGVNYSIVHPEAIVATIGEEDGKTDTE